MKTLKFDHEQARAIATGQKNSTWRLYDDKDLSVNDDIKIIDKIDPKSSGSWKIIGQARVTEIVEKLLGAVNAADIRLNDL
ncbi:MAG TPA: ASCH domain-containing protein, partial [Candidatus Nitrosopolaris sp.]|nr:ASCH domain-containing protein [Candidatus Nitrosopolaris sp.]